MGFYLRKSIRVGPMRFNFSSSGVCVSAGVRGFRVGTGPRGNYVHMGMGGIYYRAALPPAKVGRHESAATHPAFVQSFQASESGMPHGTHEALREIESTAATAIVDISSAELLREINEKRRKLRLWPLVLTIAIAACLGTLILPWRIWLLPLLAFLGASGTWLAYRRDLLAKTVVLFYGMDPEMEKTYSVLHEWANQMASCTRAWHIEAQGRVHDRKYHAGASSLVRRTPTFIRCAEPPYMKTNIETVAIGVGKQVLHFFPDRVLIFDANGVGAVGYGQLQIAVEQTRFIEEGLFLQTLEWSTTHGSTSTRRVAPIVVLRTIANCPSASMTKSRSAAAAASMRSSRCLVAQSQMDSPRPSSSWQRRCPLN